MYTRRSSEGVSSLTGIRTPSRRSEPEPDQVVVREQRNEGERREGYQRIVQPPEEAPVAPPPCQHRVDEHAERGGDAQEGQRQDGDQEWGGAVGYGLFVRDHHSHADHEEQAKGADGPGQNPRPGCRPALWFRSLV